MIKKLLFTILLGLSAFANSLTIGTDIPTLTVKDQFEKDYIVDANIKTIIFLIFITASTKPLGFKIIVQHISVCDD